LKVRGQLASEGYKQHLEKLGLRKQGPHRKQSQQVVKQAMLDPQQVTKQGPRHRAKHDEQGKLEPTHRGRGDLKQLEQVEQQPGESTSPEPKRMRGHCIGVSVTKQWDQGITRPTHGGRIGVT
jgi:hypothetical protein